MTIDHFLMFNVVFLPKLRTSIIFKTASSIVSSSNVYFFVFLPVASCAIVHYRFKLKSSIKNEIKTDIFITLLYCNTQMKALWAAKLKNKSRRCQFGRIVDLTLRTTKMYYFDILLLESPCNSPSSPSSLSRSGYPIIDYASINDICM